MRPPLEATIERLDAPLEDVGGGVDGRGIAIDQVGIKDLQHPIRVSSGAGVEQHTVARLSMSVSLPRNRKGTHMSRFLERINSQRPPISVDSFAHCSWRRCTTSRHPPVRST